MDWFRVDNRLIHGQVIETWLPFTGCVVLVVCSDSLASDPLQQDIMSLAVPSSIRLHFSPLDRLASFFTDKKHKATLVLFATCPEARAAYERSWKFAHLNIGNLHYGPDKLQLYPHIALDKEDIRCLNFFREEEVELDFRAVPNDAVQMREWE